MLKHFEELGNTVAGLWDRAGRSEESFAEIATTALADSQILTKVEPNEIISWLMTGKNIPAQQPTDFGQPPINVFVGDGFYIQVLVWLDSTTAIHEHSFCGAFGVLAGSSVQSTYSFETEKVASDRLIVGQTKFLSSELLHRGDVRTIYPGDKLIHSLFHLDRPSLSLVVRTSKKLNGNRPQYTYLRPYLAFDDSNPPALQQTQLRMLESLFQINPESFWQSAGEIVQSCEPFMLSEVLAIAYRGSADQENWDRLLGRISQQNKYLLRYILPCFTENSRINRIVALRSLAHDRTHRFFLALLLNVPAREEIYNLIATRYPSQDPQTLVLQWLSEIFNEQRAGIKLTPPLLFVIERMLHHPDFDKSRAEIKEYFHPRHDEEVSKLRWLWNRLQSLDVLRPLFTTLAAAN